MQCNEPQPGFFRNKKNSKAPLTSDRHSASDPCPVAFFIPLSVLEWKKSSVFSMMLSLSLFRFGDILLKFVVDATSQNRESPVFFWGP
jgi:hypothetical protein